MVDRKWTTNNLNVALPLILIASSPKRSLAMISRSQDYVLVFRCPTSATSPAHPYYFFIIMYLNYRLGFIRWQLYYNKTQHTNTHVTQNNTPRLNKTQRTKLHKQ
jgi:hypothetical protein